MTSAVWCHPSKRLDPGTSQNPVTTSSSTPPGEQLDIDGVPLRNQKKIDLKSILGHAPEVDDEEEDTSGSAMDRVTREEPAQITDLPGFSDDGDEYEYGYPDDDEEEEEEEEEECRGRGKGENDDNGEGKRRPPRLQIKRRSSLKTIHLPTDHLSSPDDSSPGHKKAVRFADALGLGLEAVRDLINADEPPEIPHSALKDLRRRKKKSKMNDQFSLMINFNQPSSDPDFIDRLQHQKVLLENCVTCDRALTASGVVRVIDVSYEKSVAVRYTVDSWATFRDVQTLYVPNSNDGATDRFMFAIHLPNGFGLRQGNRLEFAIAFYAGSDAVYWDSNNGKNYVVDCALLPDSPRVRVHGESSGSEGEFTI